MTREEAIWYLRPIADSASLPRYAEALNMAISALREEEVYKLPCKIGDEVFCLRNRNGKRWEIFRGTATQMYFVEDMRIGIYAKGGSRGEWGKEFFATREEAEEALKEKTQDLLLKRKKEKNGYV